MKSLNTKTLVRTALLSALAFLLTLFEIRLPFAPVFLELEIGETPALIGAFAVSPVTGVSIMLIKNIISLIYKPVALGVGQAANFLIGSVFILVTSLLYRRKKTNTAFAISGAAGIFAATLIACLANYFVLIPIYASVFGMNAEQIVSMTTAVNSNVTDMKTLIVFAIAPFNLIKYTVEVFVGYFIYRGFVHFVKD